MTIRAFFLINVRVGSIAHPIEELQSIPGIKRVEEVSGVYDFLVEVETTARLTQISERLMAKPWVQRVHVLRPIRSADTLPNNNIGINFSPDKGQDTKEHRIMPT